MNSFVYAHPQMPGFLLGYTEFVLYAIFIFCSWVGGPLNSRYIE
jgi:hypothetical protein